MCHRAAFEHPLSSNTARFGSGSPRAVCTAAVRCRNSIIIRALAGFVKLIQCSAQKECNCQRRIPRGTLHNDHLRGQTGEHSRLPRYQRKAQVQQPLQNIKCSTRAASSSPSGTVPCSSAASWASTDAPSRLRHRHTPPRCLQRQNLRSLRRFPAQRSGKAAHHQASPAPTHRPPHGRTPRSRTPSGCFAPHC